MTDTHYDIIIIGTGAAGLSAAVYAGRYNMKTLVIGAEFGGETAKAGSIENWPGIIAIDGYDLMDGMKKHAEHVGATVIDAEVTGVEKAGECVNVTADGIIYHGSAVIFAIGSERRRLGLANEHELTSRGVHYCMTCDGPLYGGKTIAIVGGGDAAAKSAALAAEYAGKIYILVRGKSMRAEPINQERLIKLSPKIEILYEIGVKEIIGEKKLEKIVLTRKHNDSSELVIDGLFIEIGAAPNTVLTKPLGVATDEIGYIIADTALRTNIPGVYVAGDIVNLFGHFKQDITASAMGVVAATSAYERLKVFREQGGCKH